jgi:hypothetical protein
MDREYVFMFPSSSGVVNAMIKVASTPCFNLLVMNAGSFLFDLSRRSWDALDTQVQQIVGVSLYAVYTIAGGTGLDQILRDLTHQGFQPLRPKHLIDNRRSRWNVILAALENFFKGTLVPLAQSNIAHADIRRGYDKTSNLLFNPEMEACSA